MPSALPPTIAALRIGRATFGELDARSLRFTFEGAGPLGQRTVTPHTEAARQLLDGAHGPAVRQALRGMAATLDGMRDSAGFRGIMLSQSLDAYAANLTRAKLDTDAPLPSPSAVRALIVSQRDNARNAEGMTPNGWVTLSPLASRTLERAVAQTGDGTSPAVGSWLAALAAHEVQHAVTPWTASELSRNNAARLGWLEEATADTLARWPGRPQRVGDALGMRADGTQSKLAIRHIPATLPRVREAMTTTGVLDAGARRELSDWMSRAFGVRPRSAADADIALNVVTNGALGFRHYTDYVAALRGLLQLGGIDPSEPANYARAANVLQNRRLARVPGALADAIVAHQRAPQALREPLRERIRDLETRLARHPEHAADVVADLGAWVAAHTVKQNGL